MVAIAKPQLLGELVIVDGAVVFLREENPAADVFEVCFKAYNEEQEKLHEALKRLLHE